MDDADIAEFAGMTVREVTAAKPLIEQSSMIERDGDLDCWHVTKWEERQFESDDVTARTAKHRSNERRRNVPTNGDRTFVGTPPETETDTETDTDVPQAQHGSLRAPPTDASKIETIVTDLGARFRA
jgi:hypothetical protein